MSKVQKKYIYGFDLSMSCTGVTIFDANTYEQVYIGSIETKEKDSHAKRLYDIGTFCLDLREQYPPSEIAIERGFGRFNTSTQVIYRVHGLINYLFHDIKQTYYPPKTVKEQIIRGDAAKKLVRQVIEQKYPGIEFKNEDESDSFAVILCHLIKTKKIQWDKKLVKSK